MRTSASTFLALLPLLALAGPLDDKTPAYFVDRITGALPGGQLLGPLLCAVLGVFHRKG